jgi:hypothetical protein
VTGPQACARAEELLSDDLEGRLPTEDAAWLAAHLSLCPACRALRGALAEVVSALRSEPELRPSPGLAGRAASAALAAARTRSRSLRVGLPPPVLALAAGLAILSTGFVLWARRDRLPQVPAGLADRAAGAQVFVVERTGRLVEDLRALRVVLAAAFEGRLEKVNDRVDDYRRLLERRRGLEPGSEGRPRAGSRAGSPSGHPFLAAGRPAGAAGLGAAEFRTRPGPAA